jgi:hypothetical protein
MTRLRWHTIGLGEWRAWSTKDGQFATAEVAISKTHRGYRIVIRRMPGTDDVAVLSLNHQDVTLVDAQDFADLLLAQRLPLQTEATEDLAIIGQRLDARPELARCRFVHAFPADAHDDARCQCGRVTLGWLKHSKASPDGRYVRLEPTWNTDPDDATLDD